MRTYKVLPFVFVAASALAGCGSTQSDGGPEYSESTTEALVAADAGASVSLAAWKQATMSNPPSAGGCFAITYPSKTWAQVPCAPAPDPTKIAVSVPVVAAPPVSAAATPQRESLPQAPSGGGTVGNGTDFMGTITGDTILAVDGTFPVVSNVTSESDNQTGRANMYALQINTNFFGNPPACNGYTQCSAVQQFEYSSFTVGGVIMEYWLFNYGQVNGTNTCPAVGGWGQFGAPNANGTLTCHALSPVTSVPVQPATSLQSIELYALAHPPVHQGVFVPNNDYVFLYVGSTRTTYLTQNSTGELSLYNYWNQVEFNVVGDWNSHEAIFNPGASIKVQTLIQARTALQTPGCVQNGITSETNNLNLPPLSGCSTGTVAPQYGYIAFTESD